MNRPLKIVIENSAIPIYKRIIDCLASTLRERSHQVSIEDPEQHSTTEAYINSQIAKEHDYTLITTPYSRTTTYIEALDAFGFELLPHGLIFLHHDNWLARPGYEYDLLVKLLSAYQKTSQRSYHFCIESSNCDDLKQLGVADAFPIRHASEFNLRPGDLDAEFGTSFVGHVLGLPVQLDNPAISHRVQRDYWSRVCDLSYSIAASAREFMVQNSNNAQNQNEILAVKAAYMSLVHYFSVIMRGDILQRIGGQSVTIFGGDPAYLSGSNMSRQMEGSHFFYHPPTPFPTLTAEVYNKSLININITPLQFDTCVINRVIDIGAAGGFPLTDWKEDLATLTSVHKEISYRSPEELQEKIAYYSHPEHQKERLEICNTLHREIHTNNTYGHVVDEILSKIMAHEESESQARVHLMPDKDLAAWNLSSELRDINILVNLQRVQGHSDGEEFVELQRLLELLISNKNSGRITLLLGSRYHDGGQISAILTELMLGFIVAGQVLDSQDLPNLIPAPSSPSLLNRIRSRLACELSISDIDFQAIQALISNSH